MMRFLLRDVQNTGPADSDKTILVGKANICMKKNTLSFSPKQAFTGLVGKSNLETSAAPIVEIGATTYTCAKVTSQKPVDNELISKAWNIFNEYQIYFYIGAGILLLFIGFSIILCCWVHRKEQQIKLLRDQHQKILTYAPKTKKPDPTPDNSVAPTPGSKANSKTKQQQRLENSDRKTLKHEIIREITKDLNNTNRNDGRVSYGGSPHITIQLAGLPVGPQARKGSTYNDTIDLERFNSIEDKRSRNTYISPNATGNGLHKTNTNDLKLRDTGDSEQIFTRAKTYENESQDQIGSQPKQGTRGKKNAQQSRRIKSL